MDDYQAKLREVNKEAHAEVRRSFTHLIEAINKLDPLKLLSQMTLSFLLVPEDKFMTKVPKKVNGADA